MTDKIIIVASGPSARGFTPNKTDAILQVNGQIDWLDRQDFWFTLDPSPENRKRMEFPKDGVLYFAAVSLHDTIPSHVMRYERVQFQGKEPDNKDTPDWWLWRWGAIKGINQHPSKINTGNSQWGAIQLAYKLGFKKVLLVGVDCTTEPKVEGGVCRNISHLPALITSATTDIEIYSTSKTKIDGVINISLSEWADI